MSDFVKRLFSSDDFMPRGHCFLWQPQIVLLHTICDALIALAYTVISLTLIYFVRKRRDLPFAGVFVGFALFIAVAAASHCLDVWTLWSPIYRFSGLVKALAAAAAAVTAILVLASLPKALAAPRRDDPSSGPSTLSGRA
jgi:hypothetical protein